MDVGTKMRTESWQTKPSDRFVLKWIKTHLSALITPRLLAYSWLRPWMITLFSSILGVAGGVIFALGLGWLAGSLGALAQVLDGVDGQFARLTGQETRVGAFWDSVLDRYADGAMVTGLAVYTFQHPYQLPIWTLLVLGFLALTGSNLVSYSTARADSLGIGLGKPTLASKGTRSTVMIICAWGSFLWPELPIVALIYLAVHPNFEVIKRLAQSLRASTA